MSRYRICVADDCEEAAAVLSEGLQLHDYDVCVAHTGAEALAICKAGGIDLILLDVCMPEMDGYEVCRQLKASPQTSAIVVVFVTVRGTSEDISRGYDLGAVDYITKPYNLPMVMVRVDAAIRHCRLQDRFSAGDESIMEFASTDSLTGLRNRCYFLNRLEEEIDKADRYAYPVSCVVFDLAEVEGLDAELGPAPVDDLLAEIALALRTSTRNNDVLARYDGTMLTALLPHTPLNDALNYASKMLSEIDKTTFSVPSFPTRATLRAGIATCQNGGAQKAEYILGEAMRGLFQAKTLPGGRVVTRNVSPS
ncbi:MAG TPA: response regulator [Candidatus Hydrogenedentes bacterium]|nr:response regulator [Candidatus Hydrogenedentota bacterium]HOS03410.1 response regulator [Candidatus Hydrogenedentota bacterium]